MSQRKINDNKKEELKNIINMYIVSRGLNCQKTAKLIHDKYPDASPNGENFRKKINSGNIKFYEVLEIADILDYDLVWKSRN